MRKRSNKLARAATTGTAPRRGGVSSHGTDQNQAQGAARPPRRQGRRRAQPGDGEGVRARGHGGGPEGVVTMSAVMEPMIHEDRLPGHESELEPKPDWQPRYPGSGRLEGKVALISGADSGIGRAVAALFAREGADVAILYLCEHDDAAKTKEIVV